MPSMRCVGYRQAWEFIDGRIDAAALRAQGIAATRQLAKRQLTWLRSLPATGFDPMRDDVAAAVASCVERACAAPGEQGAAGTRARKAGGEPPA